MRARYYDPVCGRFVREDPGRDGENWFVYCGCDPVNRVDADGRVWITDSTARYLLYVIGKVLGFSTLKLRWYPLTVNKAGIARILRAAAAFARGRAPAEAKAGIFTEGWAKRELGHGDEVGADLLDMDAGLLGVESGLTSLEGHTLDIIATMLENSIGGAI